MNIVQRTSYNATNYCPNRKIQYIVIHYTAGATSAAGAAKNTAAWFANPAAQGSADFIVDNAEIVQYNPNIENYLCWHCGDAKSYTKGGSFYGKCTNANSIGIEICSTNSNYSATDPANSPKWRFSAAAVTRAVDLTKYLMRKYNIPAERVIRHYDVSGKLCPGIIGWNAESGSEEKWLDFKKRIGGTSSPVTPAQEKTDILYRVQCGAFASKKNAEAFNETLHKKGFKDTFIVKVNSGISDIQYRVQCGAFSKKENAEAMKKNLQAAGIKDAFVTTNDTTVKKSVAEIAQEVIHGKWGAGDDRKKRLTDAGYDYTAVQAEVNRRLS